MALFQPRPSMVLSSRVSLASDFWSRKAYLRRETATRAGMIEDACERHGVDGRLAPSIRRVWKASLDDPWHVPALIGRNVMACVSVLCACGGSSASRTDVESRRRRWPFHQRPRQGHPHGTNEAHFCQGGVREGC